jgi:hypothetical protein
MHFKEDQLNLLKISADCVARSHTASTDKLIKICAQPQMQIARESKNLFFFALLLAECSLVIGFRHGMILSTSRKLSLSPISKLQFRDTSISSIRMDTENPGKSAPPLIKNLPTSPKAAPTQASKEWSLSTTEFGSEYVPWVWRGGRDAPMGRRPLNTIPSQRSASISAESNSNDAVSNPLPTAEPNEEAQYPPLDGVTIGINTVLVTVLKGAIDAFYQGQRSEYQARSMASGEKLIARVKLIGHLQHSCVNSRVCV